MPALGFSMFLITVGAILAFAVNASMTGVSLYAVGLILLTVGLFGAVTSMLFWTSFAPYRTVRTVVAAAPAVPVVHEDVRL
jgi:Domain of unknown function (DUF6458)